MLKHLKRPGLYINHGVWVFCKGSCYPVKRKILQIELLFESDTYTVKQVNVDGVGWRTPEQVYMTRKETLPMQTAILKHKLAYTLGVGNGELDRIVRERAELLRQLKAFDSKSEAYVKELGAAEDVIKKALEKTQGLWEQLVIDKEKRREKEECRQ